MVSAPRSDLLQYVSRQFSSAVKVLTLLASIKDLRGAGLLKAATLFEDRSQPLDQQHAALLALCDGPSHHFLFALRLRDHFTGVSVQQLFFARISGLFANAPCAQIANVLAEPRLLLELRADVAGSTEFLQRSVYDGISGTDYDRLVSKRKTGF